MDQRYGLIESKAIETGERISDHESGIFLIKVKRKDGQPGA